MKSLYTLLAATLLVLGSTQISCNVNQYCIECETGDGGGGSDDGGVDDANDASIDNDANDGGACVPTGPEICDGKDNDCDGTVDNPGSLPGVGDACDNVQGACAGGVKVCVQGALRCDKPPTIEKCDGIDNNCNGAVDEGDPGGGAKCGTEAGECVAGTLHCAFTTGCDNSLTCDPLAPGSNCCVTCQGFIDHRGDTEICNGKDDDCDQKLDESIGSLGTCGPTTDDGACTFGTLVCQGGGPVCTNAVFPKLETCNQADDDCDGNTDEVYNLQTDPRNCGACNNMCAVASKTCINSSNAGSNCTMDADCPSGTCAINSQSTCTTGACGITCNPGFIDRDTQAGNGCEYRCFPTGAEVCDGVDNDCDGQIDNGLTPPAICLSGGECGMTAPVAQCTGAAGWACTYTGNVQFPESRCDGLNNDCDANTDEGQPNLNQACDDGQVGQCRGTGSYQCDTTSEATRNGPALCVVTNAGSAPDANETCDDKDNDCDGKTDEGADTGSLIGQEWVDIGGGRQIMKYEASRQDATDTQQGTKAGAIVSSLVASPTGATESGTTATFTTIAPHGLTVGQRIRVTGVSVTGYNGIYVVASIVSTTQFTVTMTTSGLAASGAGSVAKYIGACSKAGAQPWTNVTYPEAQAVCQSMGASLCGETTWHEACSVVAPRDTSVAIDNGTTAASGTRIEAEDYTKAGYGGGPETGTQCAAGDAVDDDNDGIINDGCPVSTVGAGESGSQCTNNTDNDLDGIVNDGCPTQERGAETACTDTTDNDGDGFINDGCPNVQRDGETVAQCANNTDDDGDGRINDGCAAVTLGPEANCTDALDNDADGAINDGCPTITVGAESSCNDQTDNDQDGFLNDGCPTRGGSPETGAQCSDTLDNDGDGRFNDGCPAVTVGAETGTACDDNLDNDNDGKVNDGCPTVTTAGETGAQCSNNLDDDADGRINDGCAIVTTGVNPESGAQCNNNADDDNDGAVNDGCPAVTVGTGPETGTQCTNNTDDDNDGFVNDGCPDVSTGGESGTQCTDATDNDSNGFINDGCPTVGPQAWQEDYTPANPNLTGAQQNSGIADMRALANLGASVSLGNALTQAPYLEYKVNIPATATNWRVWVRMYAPTTNDDVVHVGVSTSATLAAPTTTLTASSTGQWVWMSSGDLSLTMGDNYVRVFMGDDGVKVDAIFIARSATPQPPTTLNSAGNTWSYATNATTYSATTCNGADRSTTNDDILATGTLTSCYANGTDANDVYDMSGNVKEWTLARLPGQNPIRGGASDDTATGTSCQLNFILGTDTFFFPNVGFRCCK